MKIYASAPNSKRKELNSFYEALSKLATRGHKLMNLYDDDESVFNHNDVDYFVKKHKLSEKSIKEADVVIVDVTFPGRRVGYEVARALDERKFVLAVYDEKSDAPKVATLLGLRSPNFLFRSYNAENIEQVLETALEEAKGMLDTKFILIISPQIDRYLEWASQERRMHKAQIVRDAVETSMEKDKEYQQYLKEME